MGGYRELTAEERGALERFQAAHGRRWREELGNVYWYNARLWGDGEPGDGSILHGIRNTFGPTWLWDVYRPAKSPLPSEKRT